MNRPTVSRDRSAAFTLVELLVVIGIIAVLIGVLLPVLGKARASANEAACISNLRQWGQGLSLYATESGGLLPNDGDDGDKASAPVGRWDDPALFINAVPTRVQGTAYSVLQARDLAGTESLPKAGGHSLFVCPAAGDAAKAKNEGVADGYFMMWGLPPAPSTSTAPEQRKTYACYVMNSKLNSTTGPRIGLPQLTDPAATVVMLEKRMSPGEIPATDVNADKSLARLKADWQRLAGRHRGGGMVLFADGHVARVSQQDAATPVPGAVPTDYNKPGSLVWNPEGPAN